MVLHQKYGVSYCCYSYVLAHAACASTLAKMLSIFAEIAIRKSARTSHAFVDNYLCIIDFYLFVSVFLYCILLDLSIGLITGNH